MVNQSRIENLLELEIYTHSTVKTGKVSCPAIIRVLDLLNNQFFPDTAGDENFLELMEPGITSNKNAPKMYFRKAAIKLVAVIDANTGRGIGATTNHKGYPFICRIPRQVTIDLPSHTVVGGICCAGDQSVLAVINERKAFLPLTGAIITDGSGYREERPFVAVNRHQIISLRGDHHSNTS